MASSVHSSATIDAGLFPSPWARDLRIPRGFELLLAALLAVNGVVAQESLLGKAVVEAFTARYGGQARERLEGWEQLMLSHRSSGEKDKLQQVNAFFNEVPWLSDDKHWGQRDYWATPLEMIGTHGGDCEDFSIAKYITLVKMGVDAAKLRITYVRAPRLGQPHMVLAYYPEKGAEPLILDNLDKTIRPAGQRMDLIPVYSFNAKSLWASGGAGESRRLGGAARLAAWREVSKRMRLEGIGDGG
jgi:predicted transglutaminase-like cysteine proteinase